MPLETIEPRRLYRQVADQLRSLIDAGEYAVGDRMPTERELSEQLGISRPTVREALIALEVEGRVRIRVGSGIYVSPQPPALHGHPEIDGPFELLRARELIESAVALEVAGLADTRHVAALDDVLARMEDGTHPSPETIALDRLFHVTVAGILGNAVLTRFIGELFDQRMTPYFERLSEYFETGESWQLAHAEHRLVRDAIAAGDPQGAQTAMRAHLQKSQLRFQSGFGEGEPMDGPGRRGPAQTSHPTGGRPRRNQTTNNGRK